MKKIIDNYCPTCGHSEIHEEHICDTCGVDLLVKFQGIPIIIEFGYGHELDGASYDFCNYKCLLKFIIEELKKQRPKEKNNV